MDILDCRCVVESFFSILLNGTSKGFFKSTRGLRQVDPLSPFIFTLVADGLSALLKRAEAGGLVEGFEVRDERIMVSHLQFANDTILFLKAENENIRNMDMCLKIFEATSGLKMNMTKSCMVRIFVEVHSLDSFSRMMGCRVGKWPIKYLRMPLAGNPRSIVFWDPVVEKVLKKLVTWKRNYISLGGRITLIKVALSNISVYYMSMYRMP